MFSACAHPNCRAPFDYRGGRSFRFHKAHGPGEKAPNTHSVEHFWLCEYCSGEFVLSYRDGLGVTILHRQDISPEPDERQLAAVFKN